MDWRVGLNQRQICEKLMADGSAFWLLEKAMEETTREDHLLPVALNEISKQVPSLDPSLFWTNATAVVLRWHLGDSDRVVLYEKKEVGSLIRFPGGAAGNEKGMALVDYLLKVPALMTLNDSQMVELEYLLRKEGETLGVPLPIVQPATIFQQEVGLKELALSALQTKPKVHYQKYLDMMKAKGTPVNMTQKEFLDFAAESLSNPNGYTL